MNGFLPASPSPGKDAEGERNDSAPGGAPEIPAPIQKPYWKPSWLGRAKEFVLFSRWSERGCRYLLAVIFLLAATSKIIDLSGFIDHLAIHSPLSLPSARAAGAFLPWLELSCAFCLLLNVYRRESAAILAVLLVLFIGYDFLMSAEADCGCFLLPRTPTVLYFSVLFHVSLPRNLFLLACAIRIFLDHRNDVARNASKRLT
jgi:uncharacterized membrane protein YphA (DoxX/SURF4 family)